MFDDNDISLMGFDFAQDEKPVNPYLNTVMKGQNMSYTYKEAVIKEVRDMIYKTAGDLQSKRAEHDAQISGFDKMAYEKDFADFGFGKSGEIPAYALRELETRYGFSGTPGEYEKYVDDRTREITDGDDTKLHEFFENIYEAHQYTTKSENNTPVLVGEQLRKDLDKGFDGAYTRYEKEQFNEFLKGVRDRHVTASDKTVSGVDYSREVQSVAHPYESVKADVLKSQKQAAATAEYAVNAEQSKAEPAKPVRHRGEGVFDVPAGDSISDKFRNIGE